MRLNVVIGHKSAGLRHESDRVIPWPEIVEADEVYVVDGVHPALSRRHDDVAAFYADHPNRVGYGHLWQRGDDVVLRLRPLPWWTAVLFLLRLRRFNYSCDWRQIGGKLRLTGIIAFSAKQAPRNARWGMYDGDDPDPDVVDSPAV